MQSLPCTLRGGAGGCCCWPTAGIQLHPGLHQPAYAAARGRRTRAGQRLCRGLGARRLAFAPSNGQHSAGKVLPAGQHHQGLRVQPVWGLQAGQPRHHLPLRLRVSAPPTSQSLPPHPVPSLEWRGAGLAACTWPQPQNSLGGGSLPFVTSPVKRLLTLPPPLPPSPPHPSSAPSVQGLQHQGPGARDGQQQVPARVRCCCRCRRQHHHRHQGQLCCPGRCAPGCPGCCRRPAGPVSRPRQAIGGAAFAGRQTLASAAGLVELLRVASWSCSPVLDVTPARKGSQPAASPSLQPARPAKCSFFESFSQRNRHIFHKPNPPRLPHVRRSRKSC
jgi:hypothetical protein